MELRPTKYVSLRLRRPPLQHLNLTLWTIGAVGVWVAGLLVAPSRLPAQRQQISWSEQEKPIVQALHGLRSLPDDARARETKQLALDIRALPAGDHKLGLANGLANLSTEGDFGHDTLQEVATTLAAALAEHPAPEERGEPAMPYLELAQLVRYEHVQASVDSPQFGEGHVGTGGGRPKAAAGGFYAYGP